MGKGAEESQPLGSAHRHRAMGGGRGKDRQVHKETKKEVYLGLHPLLSPCPKRPGFARARLFKEPALASLEAL